MDTLYAEGQIPQLRGEACEFTGIECPVCKAEGNQTHGGQTPVLVQLPNEQLACMGTHGIVTVGVCPACGEYAVDGQAH